MLLKATELSRTSPQGCVLAESDERNKVARRALTSRSRGHARDVRDLDGPWQRHKLRVVLWTCTLPIV